ncbi:leucine-rich repeat domain-containing protein [Fulvivirga ligni]|uniref:leucine-rich repeat domain-containing protein n=1 Tax=Fulvivirga ligni TaxID=2904246 RepID=UPI001F3B73E9|nr:leucine-rich repeat domain-containing protein [Fulvivirga ligni]UII24109.1 hypothetical protein LVD16_12865 [Fulvivirga ligni]
MKKTAFILLTFFLLATACGSDDDGPAPVMLSSEKELLSFQFLISENPIGSNVIGEIDTLNHTITAVLPGATLKTSLVPHIQVSSGATINVFGAYDFSNESTITVTAEDGSTADYEVKVMNEKDALVAIYNANPDSWGLEWDVRSDDIENWDGIEMVNGVITKLTLGNIGLTNIPPEIQYLKNLKILLIHMNDFEILPDEIGKLTNLEYFSCGINSELNYVSPQIGQLKKLYRLHLDNCRQLNSIPKEIGELSNLKGLYINGNGHGSNVPEEICNLKDTYGTTIFGACD